MCVFVNSFIVREMRRPGQMAFGSHPLDCQRISQRVLRGAALRECTFVLFRQLAKRLDDRIAHVVRGRDSAEVGRQGAANAQHFRNGQFDILSGT